MTKVVLVSSVEGGHVVVRVHVGPDDGTLQLAGELRFSVPHQVGEWQLFGAALLGGVRSIPALAAHLMVEVRGDVDVCRQLDGRSA